MDESTRALIPSLSAVGWTIFQWFWASYFNSLTRPTEGSSSHLWKWRSSARVKFGGIKPEIKKRKCGQRQHWQTRDSEALWTSGVGVVWLEYWWTPFYMAMKGVTVEDAAWKGGSLQNRGGGGWSQNLRCKETKLDSHLHVSLTLTFWHQPH